MEECAKKIAEHIKSYSKVKVITHLDADGITAGSIAKKALEREHIESEVTVLKHLDETFVKTLSSEDGLLYWFTDLGSGNLDIIEGLDVVITDHHELSIGEVELSKEDRSNLMKLSMVLEKKQSGIEHHLNPHIFEKDGASDISGAGATYLVAKAMNTVNKDLSMLAVIGAVGDLQDVSFGKLIGTNRSILEDAEKLGLIKRHVDIRFFGRETRPLHRFLMYASDPVLPVISRNEALCIKFFKDLGIPVKDGENWRCWVDLETPERKKILSELTLLLVNNEFPPREIERLIGEIYILPKEEPGTELHDAKEFATLLNSCGRYGADEIGIGVCLGDRAAILSKARKLLLGHRSNLVEMIKIAKDIGIKELKGIYHFDAGDRIGENVIGIVTGMMVNSGELSSGKPLMAFARCDDNKNIKVSIRAPREYSLKGPNLSEVMRDCAVEVGGIGGGHNVAAGAQIPAGKEKEFLNKVNQLLVEKE